MVLTSFQAAQADGAFVLGESIEQVISLPKTPEERLDLWQYSFEALSAKSNELELEESDVIWRALNLHDLALFDDQLSQEHQRQLQEILSETAELFSAKDYEELTLPLSKMSPWLLKNEIVSKNSIIVMRTPECTCRGSGGCNNTTFICSTDAACISPAGVTHNGRCVKKSGGIGIQ